MLYPVESSLFLQEQGFDVLCCPWERDPSQLKDVEACVNTVKKHGLKGIIHTTWHTFSQGVPNYLFSATHSWEWETHSMVGHALRDCNLCTLNMALRKMCPPSGVYAQSGWTENQVRDDLK